MNERLQRIGEVAALTNLSLRTLRYYEEIGLVVPAKRSAGGFRLYADVDVERLLLVKHMKPLELTLEQVHELLTLLESLDSDDATDPGYHRERLDMFSALTAARIDLLRVHLDGAEQFAKELQRRIARSALNARQAR